MITVVGLGPAGLDRVSAESRGALLDPLVDVLVRTAHHPAAVELAEMRSISSGDDLYESSDDFETVYESLAQRVISMAANDADVVYAVPGSPLVGERSVTALRQLARDGGLELRVLAAESFLDLCFDRVGVDPIADGAQILDGRNLPDPMPLHLPTLITQVDGPVLLGDVAATLGRVLEDDHPVVVLRGLGSASEVVERSTLGEVASVEVDVRTTLFVPAAEVGWLGLVATNRTLRRECPWDAEQTHHSLLKHLVEEAYETVDAITALPPQAPGGEVDYVAYSAFEDELGDLLLQVVFHSTLANEVGAFDVEQVAEIVRRKLVRRHPHVFGDVAVGTAGEVLVNWEVIKAEEKQRESLM
ncbi:MAG: nucleotide pyrophosphohydrolase, partial [Acidimicrobiia bacterium]|nr:nucleotide pyrophosphohydrolase [Acidimicrobiia bacterium]